MTVATITVHADGTSASTTVNISSPPRVANFSRVTYDNTNLPPSLGRYVLLDMGFSATDPQHPATAIVNQIHTQAPGTRALVYVAPEVTRPGSPNDVGVVPTSNAWPESYYAHDQAGGRIATSDGTFMNLGDPGWQATVLAFVRSRVSAGHFDGVFLDGVNTSLHWTPAVRSAYGTDTAYQAAWRSMLSALASTAIPMHANIGGGADPTFGGPSAWRAYHATGIVGAMEESWCVGTGGQPVPLAQWLLALANVTWSEQHGRAVMLNGDDRGNDQLAVFGLCSMLLVAEGNATYCVSRGRYTKAEAWLPAYDQAVALGQPLGAYIAQPGGYTRRFEHGTVTVDPTTHTGTIQ